MSETINEVYFLWLCDRINVNYGKPGPTFNHLLGLLHEKEFVWTVPNDDNRLEDAHDLRVHFANENRLMHSEELLMGIPPLSVLEVIVALADRLSFLDGGGPRDWAWRLIENLALDKQKDPLTPRKEEYISDVLDTLIWRTYEPDGLGGFFPLAYPEENQTKVEIWKQMNAYLAEQLER
jgi:hypothetical protein